MKYKAPYLNKKENSEVLTSFYSQSSDHGSADLRGRFSVAVYAILYYKHLPYKTDSWIYLWTLIQLLEFEVVKHKVLFNLVEGQKYKTLGEDQTH